MSAIEGRDEEVILPFTVHSFPPSLSQLYMHNDVPLATSAKVTTLAGGFLLIRNPDRNDAGQYMLTVANSRGTDSAVVTLEIFCEFPPSLPPSCNPPATLPTFLLQLSLPPSYNPPSASRNPPSASNTIQIHRFPPAISTTWATGGTAHESYHNPLWNTHRSHRSSSARLPMGAPRCLRMG